MCTDIDILLLFLLTNMDNGFGYKRLLNALNVNAIFTRLPTWCMSVCSVFGLLCSEPHAKGHALKQNTCVHPTINNVWDPPTLVKRESSSVMTSETCSRKKRTRAPGLQWEARGSRTRSIMAWSMEGRGRSPRWTSPCTKHSSCSCRSGLDLGGPEAGG